MNGWNDLPLKDIRVLAVEQMQSVPVPAPNCLLDWAPTWSRWSILCAATRDVTAAPQLIDKDGRRVGATYLRNNLGKRSIGIIWGHPKGLIWSRDWYRNSMCSSRTRSQDLWTNWDSDMSK